MNGSPLATVGIWLTLFAGMALTIVALPKGLMPFRPDWVALATVYWSMALPRRFGPLSAWVSGLLLDVLTGTLLGQHALALAVLAYLSVRVHQRVRVYPLWQQAISVGLMLAVYRLLILWVFGITGHAPGTLSYWFPLVVDVLLWPGVYVLLRSWRRRLRLS